MSNCSETNCGQGGINALDVSGVSGEEARDLTDDVLLCVDDISRKLHWLQRQYPALMIVREFSAQVGAALRTLLRLKVCRTAEAFKVWKKIRAVAFHEMGAPPDCERMWLECTQTGAKGPVNRAAEFRLGLEVKKLLSDMAERHEPIAVLGGLVSHVGAGLFWCQESGSCTPAEAQAIVRRIEKLTFADDKGPGTRQGR